MSRIQICLAGFVGVLLLGCEPASKLAKPIPVSGKVTINGQPAANVIVTFTAENDLGSSCTGTTGADGKFQLTSDKLNDGARPGVYKVVFTDNSDAGASPPAETYSGTPDPKSDVYQKMMKKGGTTAAPKESRFPAIYSAPQTTPISKKVEVGSQEFDFEIGK